MHKTNTFTKRRALLLFDPQGPRSLISVLPEAMGKLIRNLWDSHEDGYLLGLVEYGLRRELGYRQKPPTPTDNRLRVQFWMEYDRMMAMHRDPYMDMNLVIGSVMSREAFYRYYITVPEKLAWLLCPPLNYIERTEEVLQYTLDKLWAICDLPLTNDKGEVNIALAEFVFKLNQNLEKRVKSFEKGGFKGFLVADRKSKVELEDAIEEGKPPTKEEDDLEGTPLTEEQELLLLEQEVEELKKEKDGGRA